MKFNNWESSAFFLMKKDDCLLFEMMQDADAKAVIIAVFKYADGNDISDSLTDYQRMVFMGIKKHMDENRDHYNSVIEKRKAAARQRWNNSKESNAQGMQNDANACKSNAKQCKTMHMDGDTDYDSDSDYDSDYDSDSDSDSVLRNNNTLSGNPDIVSPAKPEKSDSRSRITEVYDIVHYLNEMTGKRFKPSTPKTRKTIMARLNEGFTVEEFKTVIQKKVYEWANNPDMEKYLRPETLFGTKFESYLNQNAVSNGESLNMQRIKGGFYDDTDGDSQGSGDYFFSI